MSALTADSHSMSVHQCHSSLPTLSSGVTSGVQRSMTPSSPFLDILRLGSANGELETSHNLYLSQNTLDINSLLPYLYCFIKNFIGASEDNSIGIDSKIEEAMALVKNHLMFTVREEVEGLKEKISELMERINHLETENTILRTNATRETLAQLEEESNSTKSTCFREIGENIELKNFETY